MIQLHELITHKEKKELQIFRLAVVEMFQEHAKRDEAIQKAYRRQRKTFTVRCGWTVCHKSTKESLVAKCSKTRLKQRFRA
ncbi:MAG: hypothetical protein GY748_09755 [Planctomycetaceae bacterium]|nr:hypothetical protein [Planctomycetaceae bacterium]